MLRLRKTERPLMMLPEKRLRLFYVGVTRGKKITHHQLEHGNNEYQRAFICLFNTFQV